LALQRPGLGEIVDSLLARADARPVGGLGAPGKRKSADARGSQCQNLRPESILHRNKPRRKGPAAPTQKGARLQTRRKSGRANPTYRSRAVAPPAAAESRERSQPLIPAGTGPRGRQNGPRGCDILADRGCEFRHRGELRLGPNPVEEA